MEVIIETNNLVKQYDKTTALNNVNVTFEKGKVYGLIGRNGAGKTTLLKTISNMLMPTSGNIKYNNDYIKASHDICFARDNNNYFSRFRLRQLLKLAKFIYPNWNQERADELVELFELDTKKYYQKSSKGMQTMISIIIALSSGADTILLDEPYSGLDPINREHFYTYLREHFFDGDKTVIISSHMIKEIEGYFERAIIIDKGIILIDEEMQAIKSKSFEIACNDTLANEIKTSKNVIKEKKFAGEHILSIYDTVSEEEMNGYERSGAKIKVMDLQNLMIGLCMKGGQQNDL